MQTTKRNMHFTEKKTEKVARNTNLYKWIGSFPIDFQVYKNILHFIPNKALYLCVTSKMGFI